MRLLGAAQHEVMRCEPGPSERCVWNDPGSATQCFARDRVRDTLAFQSEPVMH